MVQAQEDNGKNYQDMEDMEDENMGYIAEIYEIVEEYPDFEYRYVFRDGEVQKVIIENVEDEKDRKRLEVLIYGFKRNKEKMKGIPTRTGIFYSVDEDPEPKMGYRDFYNELYENLKYPEEAKEWGTEGNVYVKFVVKSNGEIGYMTTTDDIESTQERYEEDLIQEAKKAIRTTSGDWRPGMVEGVPVASWVVLPVVFRLETYPHMPTPLF